MLADFLLEMTVKASVVLMLAVVAARLMAAWSSAAARHLVWLAAVAGILVLPALMLFGPAWRVGFVPGAWTAPASDTAQAGRQNRAGGLPLPPAFFFRFEPRMCHSPRFAATHLVNSFSSATSLCFSLLSPWFSMAVKQNLVADENE